MKKLIIIIGFLVLIVFALWFFVFRSKTTNSSGYEFVTVTRGDILNTASSTGELEPIGTVDIGTQVSGTVDTVFVDYNDIVKKGQLLVIIDTTVLSTHCQDARNSLSKTKAQYELSKLEFENETKLFDRKLTSEYKLNVARTSMEIDRASYSSAQIALDRAKQNLGYAIIASPIDGMVINRSVEPGQTVAANLSSPTLIVIAQDLSQMRILASVDESDIGLIDTGMAALFEVPAYPDSIFTGRVTQIRLQPKVVSNVVNYTVVIEASNPHNLLMPGMTATVDFILDEKRDVLMVSNTALSFEPSRTVLASMREKMAKQRTDNGGDSSMEKPPRESGDSNSIARVGDSTSSETTQMPLRTMPSNMKVLWTLDSNGNLNPLPVTTGATDGKNTEIIPLRDEIEEGTKIVVKMPEVESNGSSNPFMPTGRGGRR